MDNVMLPINQLKPMKSKKIFGRPPPQIFQSDTLPAFNHMNNFSNTPFPGNYGPPPNIPMNTNEMFDRFNELLQWRLPTAAGEENDGHPGINSRFGGDVDDLQYPPAPLRAMAPISHPQREDFSSRDPVYPPKRKIGSNDLRNRLEQQSKRRKDLEDHSAYLRERYYENLDRSASRAMFEVDDRRDSLRNVPDGGVNDRRPEIYDKAGPSRISQRGDHIVNENDRWYEEYDRQVIQSSYDVWPNPISERYEFQVRNDRPSFESSYNPRGLWSNEPQDIGREVKEYWSERESDFIEEHDRNNGRWERGYSPERKVPVGGASRSNYQRLERARDEPNFRDYDVHYPEEIGDTRRYAKEEIDDRYSRMHQRNERYHGASGSREYLPDQSHHRPKSPIRNNGFVQNKKNSTQDNRSYQEENDSGNDLTVIIHKPNFAKITFPESDTLRTMLVDLVMKFGNPEQMPEFTTSGLMRNGKGFYVICRTEESMNWLLQQALPPLGNEKLNMRKNRMYETVKISAFAPRCTRTKDDIFKLIKLQNGKKGFNFANWSMRSYQQTPSGVYMAFDVGLDEARKLEDLECQLSFELKSLYFKIAMNSVQTVADFSS